MYGFLGLTRGQFKGHFLVQWGDLTRGAYICCLGLTSLLNIEVISRHYLSVAKCCYTGMPQTQNITPTPSQYTDTGPTCRAIHDAERHTGMQIIHLNVLKSFRNLHHKLGINCTVPIGS